MGVFPQTIRTPDLAIHKMKWRIPFRDFCSPADGDSMDPDLIINQGPGLHEDGTWGQNLETYPGWRDGLQISCISKEGKDLFACQGDPDLIIKSERSHCVEV